MTSESVWYLTSNLNGEHPSSHSSISLQLDIAFYQPLLWLQADRTWFVSSATNSQQALQQAQALAFEYKHNQIDTIHLLYALLHQDSSVVLTVLKKMEISVEELISMVDNILAC